MPDLVSLDAPPCQEPSRRARPFSMPMTDRRTTHARTQTPLRSDAPRTTMVTSRAADVSEIIAPRGSGRPASGTGAARTASSRRSRRSGRSFATDSNGSTSAGSGSRWTSIRARPSACSAATTARGVWCGSTHTTSVEGRRPDRRAVRHVPPRGRAPSRVHRAVHVRIPHVPPRSRADAQPALLANLERAQMALGRVQSPAHRPDASTEPPASLWLAACRMIVTPRPAPALSPWRRCRGRPAVR